MQYDRFSIGQMIGKLRTRKNMSQEVLSGLSGIARSHLCMIETGRKMPSVKTLSKILAALDMSMSRFFKLLEEEN